MIETTKRRGRRRVGDVVSISLDGDGAVAYALVLEQAKFAIFDGRGLTDAIAAVLHPPMFYVSVMNNAVTSGRWPIVASCVDRVAELKSPPTFMQDPLRPEKFQIYDRGVIRPATRAECEPLERTAVWDAEHVESRIRDEYAGVENRIVKSMRLDAI
jgi:hypothetical protein